jgi:hypothetical protein
VIFHLTKSGLHSSKKKKRLQNKNLSFVHTRSAYAHQKKLTCKRVAAEFIIDALDDDVDVDVGGVG